MFEGYLSSPPLIPHFGIARTGSIISPSPHPSNVKAVYQRMEISRRQKNKSPRAYDVSIVWDYINIFSAGLWMRKIDRIELAVKNARQKESYRRLFAGEL